MSVPSTSSLQVELLSRDTDVKYWLLYLFLFALLRPFAHPVACCCVSLGVVAQSLKQVKRLATCKRAQQPPTLLGAVASVCT